MRKIFSILQVIFFVVIVFIIVYGILKAPPEIDYHPETWNSWDGFYALSYAGVSNKEGTIYITKKRLKEHLSALKNAGFKTIRPDDVVNFLRNKSPLPEKAILIIFEGGRKDNYIYATPILKKLGMTATMCVPTHKINEGGSFYLSENELKKIVKQRYWDLCSMGHNAVNEVPVNSLGRKGHFLTSRMWLGKESETPSDYIKRVKMDYEKSADILRRINKKPVTTYLYPFADAGDSSEAYEIAGEINRETVSEYYKIAFTTSNHAFNGIYVNPFRLNRLRVQSDWEGYRLIEYLEMFKPKTATFNEFENLNSWNIIGDVRRKNGSIILSPNTTIWLRGSEYWSDIDIKAEVYLEKNASAIFYCRADKMDTHIRLTIEDNKLVLLEQFKRIPQTLIRREIYTGNNKHIIHLRFKGNRVWIEHNGMTNKGAIPISPYIVKGEFGIGCLGGNVILTNLTVTPSPRYYVFFEKFSDLSPLLKQKVSVMMPFWFSTDTKPRLSKEQINDVLMAVSSGVRVVPIVKSGGNLRQKNVKIFVEELTQAIQQSIIRPFITHLGVYGLSEDLLNELRIRGYKLIRILKQDEILDIIEKRIDVHDDLILINHEGVDKKEMFEKLRRLIPYNRLIIGDKYIESNLSIELSKVINNEEIFNYQKKTQ